VRQGLKRAAAALLLAACGGLQAAPVRDDGGLQVLSWNMEWLADAGSLQAAGYWDRCRAGAKRVQRSASSPALPPCDAYRRADIRDDAAYRDRKLRALRDTLAQLAAQGLDVLAAQEVAAPDALQAVLPPGWRVACIGEGPGVQHLAFALRAALLAQARCHNVPLGDDDVVEAGQRPALMLQLGERRFLNLHLKAGCSGGPMDGMHRPACATLQRQVQALQAWVDEQAKASRRFVLLGDFNRDLRADRRHPARHDGSDPATPIVDAGRIRNLWPELDDGRGAHTLQLIEPERRAARGAGCMVSLDHLAVSGEAKPPTARLLPTPPDASDHCPLLARFAR
jgi:exonuclease III